MLAIMVRAYARPPTFTALRPLKTRNAAFGGVLRDPLTLKGLWCLYTILNLRRIWYVAPVVWLMSLRVGPEGRQHLVDFPKGVRNSIPGLTNSRTAS